MDFLIFHFIVGTIVFIHGITSYRKNKIYFRDGKIIKGIVKKVDSSGGTYLPTVEFQDIDEPEKTIISSVDYGSNRFGFDIGEIVELVYYKDVNAGKTRLFIKSVALTFVFDIILIVVGALFIIFSFYQWA